VDGKRVAAEGWRKVAGTETQIRCSDMFTKRRLLVAFSRRRSALLFAPPILSFLNGLLSAADLSALSLTRSPPPLAPPLYFSAGVDNRSIVERHHREYTSPHLIFSFFGPSFRNEDTGPGDRLTLQFRPLFRDTF
jgi:hypothetical protein